jgi:hypothetical protein
VNAFGRRGRRPDDIEAELRAGRPVPRESFVHELSGKLRSPGSSFVRRRLGFAAALSAAMLIALTAVGGLGYASSATSHAVTALKNVVVKSNHTKKHVSTVHLSPALSQYKPGCGLGDKNHIHTGPPGQPPPGPTGDCPAQGTPHTP